MSKVKLLLSALILMVVTIIATLSSYLIYSLRHTDMHYAIILATHEDASYIPSSIYRFYLYTYRWTPEDIEELQSSVGVLAFFNDEDKTIDEKLFYFLLDKGLNINGVHEISGLYPLHQAILMNDLNLVRLLLLNGADPTIEAKLYQHQLNSLDFTRKLMTLKPDIDRKPIERILLEHLQNNKKQEPDTTKIEIRN